jgi:hypothetical protein
VSAEANIVGSYDLWQVQNLRLTVFVTKATIETQQWWENIFGTPAEKITTQPKQFLHQEEGPLENARMSLNINPGRIDWRLTATENLPELIKHIPTISSFSDALTIFIPAMSTWLRLWPPLKRIAFGAQLIQPTEGHSSAYQLLNRYLHSVKVDPRSSDFSYQINFRRDSRLQIPGLAINRLMRWNALRMQLELMAGNTPLEPTAARYACGLEIDTNTIPEFNTEILAERYPELFNELVDLAKEIAAKGEIP